MRIMGLDVGEKTIGVAVSDELGLTAQGIKTIRRKGWKEDLDLLHHLAREYEVQCVVVGMPRNMNGTLGPSAHKALEFVKRLQALNLPVVTEDERLTTVMAERVLIEADVRRSKRKQVVDQIAAVLILQGYLDRRARGQADAL